MSLEVKIPEKQFKPGHDLGRSTPFDKLSAFYFLFIIFLFFTNNAEEVKVRAEAVLWYIFCQGK